MQMMSKHTINHLLRAIHIIIWVKREKIESQFSLAFSWPSVRWPQLRFYRRKNGRVWIWCTISDKPGKQTNHNTLEMRNFRVRFVLTSVLARLHLLTVVSLHLSSQRSKMVLPSVDFTARFVFTNPKICKKTWLAKITAINRLASYFVLKVMNGQHSAELTWIMY